MKKLGFTLFEGATHVDIPPRHARFGFTLAEVLITMGVIGIVAALTIPSLSSSYQKRVLTTQLQKAYSEISQAGAMVVADEMGSDFRHSKAIKNSKFLGNFLKTNGRTVDWPAVNAHSNPYNLGDGYTCQSMKSGAIFCIDKNAHGALDTNGAKGPNTAGQDIFEIWFNADGTVRDSGDTNLKRIIDNDWDLGN